MYRRTLSTAQTWPRAIFSSFQNWKEHIFGMRYRSRSAFGSAVQQFLMGVTKDKYNNCFKNGLKGWNAVLWLTGNISKLTIDKILSSFN